MCADAIVLVFATMPMTVGWLGERLLHRCFILHITTWFHKIFLCPLERLLMVDSLHLFTSLLISLYMICYRQVCTSDRIPVDCLLRTEYAWPDHAHEVICYGQKRQWLKVQGVGTVVGSRLINSGWHLTKWTSLQEPWVCYLRKWWLVVSFLGLTEVSTCHGTLWASCHGHTKVSCKTSSFIGSQTHGLVPQARALRWLAIPFLLSDIYRPYFSYLPCLGFLTGTGTVL